MMVCSMLVTTMGSNQHDSVLDFLRLRSIIGQRVHSKSWPELKPGGSQKLNGVRMDGLSPTNHRARERGVVMHDTIQQKFHNGKKLWLSGISSWRRVPIWRSLTTGGSTTLMLRSAQSSAITYLKRLDTGRPCAKQQSDECILRISSKPKQALRMIADDLSERFVCSNQGLLKRSFRKSIPVISSGGSGNPSPLPFSNTVEAIPVAGERRMASNSARCQRSSGLMTRCVVAGMNPLVTPLSMSPESATISPG